MKKSLIWTLIVITTLFQTRHFFRSDFPYTHDGENHLARFANYKAALKEGQLPPRFAPNLMNHYGYPVFNFNYPLANILSLPFSLIRVNPETTFKIITTSSFFLSLVGIYFVARLFNVGNRGQLFAILLFGMSPYFTNLLLFRGNIGEFMALCFLPWLLYSIHSFSKNKKLNYIWFFVWSAFLLSHNLTVVLVTPFFFIYAFIFFKEKKVHAQKPLITFLLAALSVSWFWIPAVLESKFTVVNESSLAKDFLLHFPTLSQLLWGQLQFGFSTTTDIDSLGFQLGLSQCFVLIVALMFLTKSVLKNSSKSLKIFCFLAILSIFFQLSVSQWFWKLFPFLHIIQFPWRFSLFFVIAIPIVFLYLYPLLSKTLLIVVSILLVLQIVVISKLKPADFFHRDQIDYDLYAQSTSTQNENRAKEFTYLDIGDWQPKPQISPHTEFSVLSWTGSERKYTVNATEPVTVIEPTMNFPGWMTSLKKDASQQSKVTYLPSNQTQGRIGFFLEPGNYTIHTRFTQNTPARLTGNTLSLLSLVGYLFYFFYDRKQEKNSN